MIEKRADELRVGDIVQLGMHINTTIVRIIQESPRVLLIHIKEPNHRGLPWVYRKRASTKVRTMC